MKPTYDAHQMAAQLRLCKVCHQEKWMTDPQAVCIRCRQEAATKRRTR